MKLVCLSLLALVSVAQRKVEFEVASIKPYKGTSNSSGVNHENGLWRARNTSTKALILDAFEILPEQIIGAPTWLDSDRFDIEARYDKDPAQSGKDDSIQTQLRIVALLESRFQLKFHRETKEWQSYVLVVGKKGPKLTPTTRKEGSSMRSDNGHLECQGVSLENFARSLARRLGRPVADHTGLDGRFDFTLDFDPEIQQNHTAGRDAPIAGVENRNPSLVTALQDQLGLKLETRKARVEMLIIDRIERPSEN